MSTQGRSPAYYAFLLRCWLDGTNWRYSLEQVGSGKRQGFATLDEFVAFLVAMSALPDEGGHTTGIEDALINAKNEQPISANSSSIDE